MEEDGKELALQIRAKLTDLRQSLDPPHPICSQSRIQDEWKVCSFLKSHSIFTAVSFLIFFKPKNQIVKQKTLTCFPNFLFFIYQMLIMS